MEVPYPSSGVASTPGSLNSHYSVMLSQLSDLKQELEKATSQNHSLVEQNKSMQSLYNALKAELAETKKRYTEAQENYLSTVSEKFEMERQNESFMESLKHQLTEKTREFEALRDKFAPQDIDYIRIKVQEELEVPHRAKVQGLEREVEKQREQYFSMRRNFELLKVERETQNLNHTRELNALQDAHDSEVSSLKKSISNLRDREYSPEKDEQLRLVSIKVHELDNQLKVVTQEAATLRQERDNAVASADLARSRHDEAYVALRTRCSIADTELHTIAHKNTGLLSEIEKKDGAISSLRQSIEDLEKQLSYFKTLASERETYLIKEKSQHDEELDHIRSMYDRQMEELEEKNSLLMNKLRDREEALRRAQRDAGEMQLRAESLESEVRKSYFNQLLEARQRAESLELEVCEARDSHRQAELQLKLNLEQSAAECDRLKSENSRLSREKDVLHGHLRDLDLRIEGERRAGVDSKRVREELQRLLKSRESELMNARKTAEELSSQINDMMESAARKELEHKKQWEFVQSEVQKRYENLGHSYKRKIEDCIKKGREAVLKERKRADAYKTRAVELHRKHKHFQMITAASASEQH